MDEADAGSDTAMTGSAAGVAEAREGEIRNQLSLGVLASLSRKTSGTQRKPSSWL